MDLPQRVKALMFDKDDTIDAEGRYKFVKRLGSGAMGKVFLFQDTRMGNLRALKTVEEILTQFPEAVEKLKSECEIMQVLTHPNIVAVRDLVMDRWGYRYYIVMDYAKGETLREYLKKHSEPEQGIVLEIIRLMAEALDYAHGCNIVHGDVKTDNVMVTFDGEKLRNVKLLDFGIGRKINEILMATTGGSAGGGAPAYRSPEGWRPKQYGKVSARSDQYSLAVMAYEMLAGRRPYWEFEADNDTLRGAVLDQDEIPERIGDVEDYVNDALLKALSKRQEDRFESCGAFAKALTTAPAAPKPVTIKPPAVTPPPRPVVVEKPSPVMTPPPQPPVIRKTSSLLLGKEDMVLTLPGDVPLELVHIRAGSFMMGSPESEALRVCDERQHRVTLTKDFWLGRYEVTQGQWQAVMGSNPSQFKNGDRYPVEQVSWNDAMEFCRKVTERERTSGRLPAKYEYTLPTEAQWEYACRAGTTTPFSFGSALNGDKANCDGNCPYGTGKGKYLKCTTPVGIYAPNAWGLYDMHGNVSEWCRDRYYEKYPSGDVSDPVGPWFVFGSTRVLRGGSWDDYAECCRSASRNNCSPAHRGAVNLMFRSIGFGFRVALAPVQ